MGEQLIFKDIDKAIDFKALLDYYDISYEEDKKGDLTFTTTNAKNHQIQAKAIRFPAEEGEKPYFFTIKSNIEDKKASGTPINFAQWHDDLPIREAASKLKKIFVTGPKKKEIPEYDLKDHEAIEIFLDLRRSFEFGYCDTGYFNGYIVFKVYNPDNTVEGYVGWNVKTKKWHFPEGFKRPIYNLERAIGKNCIIVPDLFEFLYLHLLGHTNVVCTMGASITDHQLEQLKKFNKFLLLHQNPKHLIEKLSSFAYVKAPKLEKKLTEHDDIDQYL